MRTADHSSLQDIVATWIAEAKQLATVIRRVDAPDSDRDYLPDVDRTAAVAEFTVEIRQLLAQSCAECDQVRLQYLEYQYLWEVHAPCSLSRLAGFCVGGRRSSLVTGWFCADRRRPSLRGLFAGRACERGRGRHHNPGRLATAQQIRREDRVLSRRAGIHRPFAHPAARRLAAD